MFAEDIAKNYQAVMFDLGGVMVSVEVSRAKDKIASVTGFSESEIDEVIFGSGLKAAFDAGRIDVDGFCREVIAKLGQGLDRETLEGAWTSMFEEIDAGVELLKSVSSLVPCYVASNTDPLHLNYIKQRFSWFSRFSGIAASFELGVLKPDAGFYRMALDKFGLTANRCLFLDDRLKNITAAKNIGLHTVHVTNARESSLSRSIFTPLLE